MSLFTVKSHKLSGKEVKQIPSPNRGKAFKTGLPDTIIIHYTAGADFDSSVKTLCNPINKVSAHLVIGRKGEIAQLVPFDIVAWHAGKSSFQGRNGINDYAIGIELDNAGILELQNGGLRSWFGRKYPAIEAIEAVHRNEKKKRFWHAYTPVQIEKLKEICACLVEFYPIKFILGHEEISPGRKTDPGPAFSLDQFRAELLNPEVKSNLDIRAVVKASSLNVRSGPGAKNVLSDQPLLKGTAVTILEEQNGWSRIAYLKEGWVSNKYLDKQSS